MRASSSVEIGSGEHVGQDALSIGPGRQYFREMLEISARNLVENPARGSVLDFDDGHAGLRIDTQGQYTVGTGEVDIDPCD